MNSKIKSINLSGTKQHNSTAFKEISNLYTESTENQKIPRWDDVKQAADRIKGYIHKTPIMTSQTLNRENESQLFFKCENFQKTGAFKYRGAVNSVLSLSKQHIKKGVATHSSGNHGAALASAALCRQTHAYIVMPENAAAVKITAAQNYGAQVIFCAPTLKARQDGLERIVQKTGAYFVHPYNNPAIIAGQGTAAMEMIKEINYLDYIVTPVGGGGLLSGTAIAAKHLRPDIKLIGAEPRLADDAFRSFHTGKLENACRPTTIADGLRTSLGSLTFSAINKYVDNIMLVSETEIIKAMRMIWERLKILIEPSSAVPVAAVIFNSIRFKGLNIGIILSGGNVQLDRLPWTQSAP
ncbi:MAG: pyridoxal-phosphate dependent enzyme [Caldithrix sp.]|nr:pyridoxal-phosphate dependent enzyme [Caldithrix sp.]